MTALQLSVSREILKAERKYDKRGDKQTDVKKKESFGKKERKEVKETKKTREMRRKIN